MGPDHDGFLRIVKALAPYLDDLVVAGGWCHRLLQFHPQASSPGFAPLMTEDTDIVTPERLRPRTPSIDAALTAEGLRVSLLGSERLPVMRYYVGDDEDSPYVEFIAPLRGNGYTRKGERDDMAAIAGITAQRLRYVELLLCEPWTLELTSEHGFGTEHEMSEPLVLRVATPTSYLAQKVLTLRKRKEMKRAKDALYLHDTLLMFGASADELREPAARLLEQLPVRTRRSLQSLRVSIFDDESLLARAANIASESGRASPPTPATIKAVCTLGLERIFAP